MSEQLTPPTTLTPPEPLTPPAVVQPVQTEQVEGMMPIDNAAKAKLDAKVAGSIATNPVAKLDVAVLHDKIIAPGYGIHAIEKSEMIDFRRDAEEAVQKVKSGDFDLAIFLRPTSLKEMLYVSKKGLKMPQKSTYFYPKLLTGLLFYGMSNDQA